MLFTVTLFLLSTYVFSVLAVSIIYLYPTLCYSRSLSICFFVFFRYIGDDNDYDEKNKNRIMLMVTMQMKIMAVMNMRFNSDKW